MSETNSAARPFCPRLAKLYHPFEEYSWPLVRFAAGLFLIPHGAQKLFGWFGGRGLDPTIAGFAKLGFEPGRLTSPRVGGVGLGRSAVMGAVTLVALWPVMQGASFVLGALARAIQQEPVARIAHDTLRQLVESPADAWLVVMALVVVFAAPVLEEVMYRGILQRTIIGLDLGRWTAILITSGVFVSMHVGVARWHALPALFVLSLGFGWVYERTGRLAAPIAMHVLFNALNLGLAWWTVAD